MKPIRLKYGYGYNTNFALIGKDLRTQKYIIQLRFFKLSWFHPVIYNSIKKPKIKHLGIIGLLSPICLIMFSAFMLLLFFIGGISFLLNLIGCIFKALALAVLFKWKAAKYELEEI